MNINYFLLLIILLIVFVPSVYLFKKLRNKMKNDNRVLVNKIKSELLVIDDVRKTLKKLEGRVLKSDAKIGKLLYKYKNKPEKLEKLPMFCDPKLVVPEFCRKQLCIYLQTLLSGYGHQGCLRTIIKTRYRDNQMAYSCNISEADFVKCIGQDITIEGLCKLMLSKEQNLESDDIKKRYVESLINKFFSEC